MNTDSIGAGSDFKIMNSFSSLNSLIIRITNY